VPAPPEERDDRLEVLSEALAQLVRRQRELEARVRALESHGTPELSAESPAEPIAEPVVTPPPLPAFDPPPPRREEPTRAAEPVPLETTFGLHWINRIAVFTLLLGAAFLFKYGVDNDWFGPGVRVAMGVAAAVISLLAGDRLWRRGQTVFAQGIIGLGLALLYLSIYAAAMLYHLLPQSLAFISMCGVTAAAAGLALLYNSQAVAVIAMIGGYLTPPALSTGEDHPWVLFGYVFLLNLGGLLLARKKRWSALEPLAAAATILLYAGWFNQWFSETNRPVATVFAFAFYAQFSVAILSELWAVFQLAASVALALIWQNQAHFLWWNVPIVAGGLAPGLVSAYRRSRTFDPILALGCYWLPFWFWYSPDASFAAISVVFLIFFAWSLWRAGDRTLELALIAANAAVYYAASYSLLNPAHHQYMGLLAAGVGGIHLPLARSYESRSEARVLTLGVALAFVTLAVPIQFAGFRVTIAWALEGAVLAWLCARFPAQFQNGWLRVACRSVLTLAVFRLLVFDVLIYSQSSEYSALLNTRFLTFAVSAAALWLAARFLAPATDAVVSYIAGHAVLLFGLSLEIGGWVSRNIAPEDRSGVQIIAVSVMLTVYAVILVLIGVRAQAAIHRLLGLALVVLVVAKLYLVDVWVLGRLFRITAFLALGVLLLALSYLYSRLRPVLDRFLKADPPA
jgi:uncharacterized membrane protein